MNIEANAASVLGRDHRSRESNRQDAVGIRRGVTPRGRPFAVGAVADGCGSALRSEVGAAILVAAAVEEATRALLGGGAARHATEDAFQAAARALRWTAAAVGRGASRLAFVETHLLSTLLLVVHDGDEMALRARGDGLIVVDDEVIVLHQGAAPDYLAYDITGAGPVRSPFVAIRDARDVQRVAIATDGIDAETALGAFGRPGRRLQRFLNVEATRRPLLDDASVVVLEVGA